MRKLRRRDRTGIRPGTVYNDVFSHYDLIPTFAAAGGDPDIVAKCHRGSQIGNKTFKVHLDANKDGRTPEEMQAFMQGTRRSVSQQ